MLLYLRQILGFQLAVAWVQSPLVSVIGLRKDAVRRKVVPEEEEISTEIFAGLESVNEAMWRRVRAELYGGPDCHAPSSLARFEAHCELRRASASEDWLHLDNGERCVYAEQQYPGLEAKPVWEEPIDWLLDLSENYGAQMCQELKYRAPSLPFTRWTDPNSTRDYDSGWGMVHLHHYRPHLDKKCPRDLFPLTVQAIDSVSAPMAPRYTSLARQRAGRAIRSHTDRIPWILTAHLPLFGPRNGEAALIVNGTKVPWIPMQPTVVDTTFHHLAENTHATQDMYLLHIDFFHPDLSTDEMHALSTLHMHLEAAKAERAEELKPMIQQLEASFRL